MTVLHVIGDDTPAWRLERVRALYAQAEAGRQRVVQFGNRRLDCSGLGTVERVRVPLGVDWLACPTVHDLLPAAGANVVHVWSVAALAWASQPGGFRVVVDVEARRGDRRLAERLAQVSSSVGRGFVGTAGAGPGRYVCSTEAARRRLCAIGVPGEACALIRDSVDFAAIDAADRGDLRRQLDISPEDAAALILPPLRRDTGSLVASWGAMLLEHARAGVRLLMVNVGREAGRVVRLVESCGLHGILRLAEWRFTLPELLAAADVAVYLPTGDAPLWGVAHAMAAGRPIVASDVPVVRELLTHQENAWLCRADDPKDACRWMLRALDDREQSDCQVRAARAQANAAFERRRMIEEYFRVYADLLADGRIGGGLGVVGLVR